MVGAYLRRPADCKRVKQRPCLYVSTEVFLVALAATFLAWHIKEHRLSIHAIDTHSREAFYWAAILFTFARGTAAGDLLSEQMGMDYAKSGLVFGGGIALITVGYVRISRLTRGKVSSFFAYGRGRCRKLRAARPLPPGTTCRGHADSRIYREAGATSRHSQCALAVYFLAVSQIAFTGDLWTWRQEGRCTAKNGCT